jgi:hypothetical protein
LPEQASKVKSRSSSLIFGYFGLADLAAGGGKNQRRLLYYEHGIAEQRAEIAKLKGSGVGGVRRRGAGGAADGSWPV